MAESRNPTIIGVVVVAALAAFVGMAVISRSATPAGPDLDELETSVKAKAKAAKAKAKASFPKKQSLDDLRVRAPEIARAKAPDSAPNVVLVVITAARKDQLTPYGGAANVTPFLNGMAAKGARFMDTVSESPYARAASTALLTGRHSWSVGMVEPGPKASERSLDPSVATLAERLRGAGWTTLGLTANFNTNSDSGLGRGFDIYQNAQVSGFAPGRRHEAAVLTKHALQLLETAPSDRPFYLQLDYVDLHAPVRIVKKDLEPFEPGRPGAAYRTSLNRIDKQLRNLWSAIEARGEAENTVLVVVGDHGEGLGTPAHHGRLHGNLMYESSIIVPWIMVGPGIAENQLVGGLAASVDVAPTLLDIIGQPVPTDLDGMSHGDLLRGKGARTSRELAHSMSWHFTTKRASSWTSKQQCQLDFGSVDVKDSFVPACYDRRVDPTFTRVVESAEAMAALKDFTAKVEAKVGSAAP